MPKTLTAIDTRYNGYFFRSRLEARWAVFYDSLRVSYQYEPQGFDLDGVAYLPDFWLPDQGAWVEIKGLVPSDDECDKANRLAELSGYNVYVFYGEIGNLSFGSPEESAVVFYGDGYHDASHWWCECLDCGSLGIQFVGRSERLGCGCRDRNGPDLQTGDTRRLRRAYEAARSARF